ncbi:MAG: lysophospholipase [Cyclobacteriaceae bacterium]
MTAETNSLLGPDGLKLFYRYWIPQQTEKILCIIHGHGEHSGRYEHVAQYLSAHNVAVFAMDLRGHGKSKGKRGHAPSQEVLLRDIEELVKAAREMYNDLPLFIMGHSMGGNLVANFMIENKSKEITGFMLSSPWLKLAFDPPKIKMQLGKLMSKIWPAFSEHNGLDINHISKDPEEVKKYKDDPLVHGMISAGLFQIIDEACEKALTEAASINTPGLIYHGSSDMIIDYTATEKFAKSNSLFDWHLLDGVYHEPHNDLEKSEVLKMLADWIKKKT